MSSSADRFLKFLSSVGTIGIDLFLGPVVDGARSPTLSNQIILGIILIIMIYTFLSFVWFVYNRINGAMLGRPWIVKDTKDAREAMRIPQDPADESSILLRRSVNEDEGIESSYMWWSYIDDFHYNQGTLRPIFFKGDTKNLSISRAPGVYLAPEGNSLLVYMNTYSDPNVSLVVDNLASKMWMHFALVVTQKTIEIYVNGHLKVSKVLTSLPRQNFGDLHVNTDGGYSGYLSRLRYFDYAVTFSEIDVALNQGPSSKFPTANMQLPPYLATSYWL